MRNKLVTMLKIFFGLPLSLVALFFIVKLFLSQGQKVVFHFPHINLFALFSGIMLFVIYFFLRGFFWKKLLETHRIETSSKETIATWAYAEFARYIPGNLWSVIKRIHGFNTNSLSKTKILSLIAQEVIFLLVASVIVSIPATNFIVYGFKTSFPMQRFAPFFLVALCVLGAGIFLFYKPSQRLLSFVFPRVPLIKRISLLSLMSLSLVFFGLGSFFSVSALFSLYLPHMLSLSGFFVLSFLIGYLSFITPMGLGVREAVMTAGLSKYMALGNAALSSLFSRLILIISELLFLGIVSTWTTLSSRYKNIEKIEQWITIHRYEIFTLLAVALYIGYFTLASFLRYTNFFTGRFDLGNMDQTVWNTFHGRTFQLTDPNGTNIISRLAFHADFMLILLAPFYYVWQDPRMLLLVQSVCLGIGGLFVFLIANHLLKNKQLSFVFSLSYLIYPALNNANLYDFHAVVLAAPLFLASWYYILKKQYIISTILLFLAGTTKEEVWFITGLIGLYFIFWEKKRILGGLISLVSFTLFYYLFWHAIPQARGGEHFALAYYSDFGTTPTSVLKNIFLSPLKTMSIIFSDGQIKYLLELFFPVAFACFLAPWYLFFILPDLGISLLSNNAQLHNIGYHYGAVLVPFIFIATIYGIAFLQKHIKNIPIVFFSFFILIPSLIAAYWYGPLPGAIHMNGDMFTQQLTYRTDVDKFLLSIPKRYSVAASNNVGSHLSHRQRIYTIPIGIDKADIVVLLLNDQFAQPSLAAQKQLAEKLRHDPNYVKLFEEQDFIVFKKKSVPTYIRRKQNGLIPLFKGN